MNEIDMTPEQIREKVIDIIKQCENTSHLSLDASKIEPATNTEFWNKVKDCFIYLKTIKPE